MSSCAVKLQTGAYLTDGIALFEVGRVRAIGDGIRVELEDCKTFAPHHLDMTKLHKFRLVRAAEPKGNM
jgi:hypothetical protein